MQTELTRGRLTVDNAVPVAEGIAGWKDNEGKPAAQAMITEGKET